MGSDTNQTNTIIPWDFSSSELFCFGGLVTKLCPTFVTPWTIACWSFHPWNSPSKNTRVGCHFLLQETFPTQGWNPCLLHISCIGRWILTSEPPGKSEYAGVEPQIQNCKTMDGFSTMQEVNGPNPCVVQGSITYQDLDHLPLQLIHLPVVTFHPGKN